MTAILPGNPKAVRIRAIRGLFLALVCLAPWPARGAEDTPFTRIFDTRVTSNAPWAGEAITKRAGWMLVPEDHTNHAFAGDAVLVNDKLAVVLRSHSLGAEVYTVTASGLKYRATVAPVRKYPSPLKSQSGFEIVENTAGAVMVKAAFANPEPAALRFRLTTGEAILEIRPEQWTSFVQLESPASYVVVPDYFGDDRVFGPDAQRGRYLPAENFCLNLIQGGDALIMAVWPSRDQDLWLPPAAVRAGAGCCSSQIRCLPHQGLWLAFLESPGLWRATPAPRPEPWRPPFSAKWRCSFVRENGAADSWDWEHGPDAGQTNGLHQGPLVIYPLDRSATTPLTASCPTDVIRNTLGVGPCQYILACEGLSAQGDPTPNSVMTWVEKQFEQKKQKKAAEDIQERLGFMTAHVAQARTRIQRYAEFAGQIRARLANQSDAETFRGFLDELDRAATAGLGPAASPESTKQLAGEVTALLGRADSLAACQILGRQLRVLGEVQDRALAKCRMAVRCLRAQGKTVVANQPQDSGLAQEVLSRAEQMLREPLGHANKVESVKP